MTLDGQIVQSCMCDYNQSVNNNTQGLVKFTLMAHHISTTHSSCPQMAKKISLNSMNSLTSLRAHLHQASTLQQLIDDATNSVLIENNGVTPEWTCNPFLSDSIVFDENRIASVIVELSQC